MMTIFIDRISPQEWKAKIIKLRDGNNRDLHKIDKRNSQKGVFFLSSFSFFFSKKKV